MQSLCDIEIVRILPPQVFWPRPKVHSAIIHIVPNPEKRARIPDLAFFHDFVRGLFLHRRKFLRSGLVTVDAGTSRQARRRRSSRRRFNFPVDIQAEQLSIDDDSSTVRSVPAASV